MFAVNPRVHRVVDPHSGPFGHCEHMPLRTEPHTSGERGPTARVHRERARALLHRWREAMRRRRGPRLGTGRLSRKPRRPFTKNLSAHVDHRRLRLHTPDDLHRSLLHSEHLNASLPVQAETFVALNVSGCDPSGKNRRQPLPRREASTLPRLTVHRGRGFVVQRREQIDAPLCCQGFVRRCGQTSDGPLG